MTDQKLIADIFNVFMKLYKGKAAIGLQQLYKDYGDNEVFSALVSNLNKGLKISIPDVMKEIYSIYQAFRDDDLNDEDWQVIVDSYRGVAKKWENNEWCNGLILAMLDLLDNDDKERRKIHREIAEEMEAAMRENEEKTAA